jgi:hypothetical protein
MTLNVFVSQIVFLYVSFQIELHHLPFHRTKKEEKKVASHPSQITAILEESISNM